MEESKKKSRMKDIDFDQLSQDLVEFAEGNCSHDKMILMSKVTAKLKVSKNIIYKAYALAVHKGLQDYRLIEDKPAPKLSDEKAIPKVNSRNMIIIPKHYLEDFNKNNPENAYKENQEFEITVTNDSITLKRT